MVNKNGLPNPVCTLTVELPWPLRGDERQFWGVDGGTIVGFTPVTLAAEVTSRENAITWMPLPPTQKWLNERLLQMFTEMTNQQDPRVLVRLKLAGNFIWGPQRTPKLHLDGEVFGIPADGRVDIGLPSGNGRRGGDLDMWFWLFRRPQRSRRRVLPEPRQPVLCGRSGRNIARQGSACNSGSIDQQPNLRSLLPAGYQVDASQRFSANDAAAIARRSGVPRLVGLVSDRYDRLGRFLSERLQGTLQIHDGDRGRARCADTRARAGDDGQPGGARLRHR